jgi:hypothetical protein
VRRIWPLLLPHVRRPTDKQQGEAILLISLFDSKSFGCDCACLFLWIFENGLYILITYEISDLLVH